MAAVDEDVFVPPGAGDDGTDDEASEGDGDVDTLLGNAFDALQDGDRDGFIKSLRAALNGSGE